MKSNDLSKQVIQTVYPGSNKQELEVFNRRRTIRGLLPVTQEEFNELLMKVTGFTSLPWNTATFH
jgi:hypothetical protein